MSYPHPAVAAELREFFVCARVDITADRGAARQARVLWTPTLQFWSRHGIPLRESVGFLPPLLLLQQLRLARALDALRSARFDQAQALFQQVAETEEARELAPEALYWVGIAGYLRDRDHAALRRAWRPLRERFPASSWAARTEYSDPEAGE